MKGFDFLWEPDPSCSECRLNSGCLQSKGNSHGRLEPCCFHEKEETGPTQIQPRTAAHGPVWAGGRPTEMSSDNERSAERSAHMWLPTERRQRFPFFSFLFCFSYLGAKSQREEVREYTEILLSTIFFFSPCHIWFGEKMLTFGHGVSWRFHLSVSKSIFTSGWTPVSSFDIFLLYAKDLRPHSPLPLLRQSWCARYITIFPLSSISFM